MFSSRLCVWSPVRVERLGLLGVQPLVGQPQHLAGRPGIRWQGHGAAGSADCEPLAAFGQRRAPQLEDALRSAAVQLGEDTELVAAQAVGAADRPDGVVEVGAEAPQQGVADGVPEGVVVGLEAVEIEEDELVRGQPLPGAGQEAVEVSHQRPAVAQAGEVIGERLVMEGRDEFFVLAEADCEARGDQKEGGGGEPDRCLRQPREVVPHQHPHGDDGGEQRHEQAGPVVAAARDGGVDGDDRGDSDREGTDRPEQVREARRVVAVRSDPEVDAVGSGPGQQAGADYQQRPRVTNPADGQHRREEGDQHHVAQRIGQVREHHGCPAVRHPHQRRAEQRDLGGRRRDRCDRAVEEDGAAGGRDPLAGEQRDGEEEARDRGEVAEVGPRGIRLVGCVVELGVVVEVAGGPGQQAHGEEDPRSPVVANHDGPGEAGNRGHDQGAVVEEGLGRRIQ